jgi:hypothetical protein
MVERTDKLRGANLVAGTLVRSHPGCGRYHSATKGEDYRDGRLKKPVISPPVTFDFFSALIRIRVHHTQRKKPMFRAITTLCGDILYTTNMIE